MSYWPTARQTHVPPRATRPPLWTAGSGVAHGRCKAWHRGMPTDPPGEKGTGPQGRNCLEIVPPNTPWHPALLCLPVTNSLRLNCFKSLVKNS